MLTRQRMASSGQSSLRAGGSLGGSNIGSMTTGKTLMGS